MKGIGYKDMNKFHNTKMKQKKRYYKKTESAPNKGKPWSKEEIELVISHDYSDTELSEKLGRSVMAIQKQRQLYKKQKTIE